ncbi:MAG TPA: hypothetical protein V6D15_25715 [Oculatellaceae cyanobacterium]|jgi:hypothetical protein
MERTEINSPLFELHEFVVLHWDDQHHKTKVVRRWLDFDDGDGCWWYQLNSMGSRLYPESAIEVDSDH